MKGKMFFLLISLITTFSCNGNNNEITTKCPLGAPSILFYNQGNNSNFETTSGAAQIIAEFQQTKYDALVVDATSGLKQITTYKNSPYRLAKLLTAGNLYLVSINKTIAPSKDDSLLSFGNETSIPYLVTNKLNKTWNCKVEYEKDVANVLVKAISNLKDYYVLAEPSLTALEAKQKINYKEKLEINEEDKIIIPQAALFINKKSYYNKKDKFVPYINELNERINVCISNPQIMKDELDKYGGEDQVKSKFGFTSNIAYSIQSKNNGFALYESNKKFTYVDINNFLSSVGAKERYTEEDYFINVE